MLAATQQSPLLPDPTELIVGLITFAIIFVALWRLLLPRMTAMLEARTDQIEGGLKRAQETQAAADQVLGQYRAQLADARHEAARLREAAKEEAAQIVAQGRADAVVERQRDHAGLRPSARVAVGAASWSRVGICLAVCRCT